MLSCIAACGGMHDGHGETPPPAPERPADCREISGGGDLSLHLTSAREGETLCLAPGRWFGPVTIEKRLTLWGPREAVIEAGDSGSVVTIAAPSSTLLGTTIDGTGGHFETLDAAVHVIADDVRVQGVRVVNSVFGVLVENVERATIIGNYVSGNAATAMGMRGDTIRLWETSDSVVAGNLVEDGRDIVVWYSSRNKVTGNRVLRGRYGTHFMYSSDTEVSDNAYVDGVVGVFVMYSHRVALRRNLVLNASGASGMAIGLKDSGDVVIEDNVLVHDFAGIYIDGTPDDDEETLEVRGNVIRQCTTGVHFHTTPRATTFEGNDLADNVRQIAADAGTQPTRARWRSNYFDDYTGYDLDDDGIGDLPHRAESASEDLVAKHPTLAFLRGAPALALVDIGNRLLPLWEPRVLLIDDAPRMGPRPLPELRVVAKSTGRRPGEVRHAD